MRQEEATMLVKARKAISFVFLLKSMVGCSIAVLALFGVAIPHFGIEPTAVGQGVAASFGAGIGAFLALRG